jgi:hypothetical protein
LESREGDLIGGLRNALDRGEQIQKAMQSFINAGYTAQEVELAARKLEEDPSGTQGPPTENGSNPLPQIQPGEKKSSKKWLIITLAVLTVLVLFGLSMIFVFRDSLF